MKPNVSYAQRTAELFQSKLKKFDYERYYTKLVKRFFIFLEIYLINLIVTNNDHKHKAQKVVTGLNIDIILFVGKAHL
jgi:predicted HAD superfamily phosphohydrolase YqeG